MERIFRLAELADAPCIAYVLKHVYIDTYMSTGVTNHLASFMSRKFAVSQIEKEIKSDMAKFIVACEGEKYQGVLKIKFGNACPIGYEVYPEIGKLYVMKPFFGQGIGFHLMKNAENYLKSNGADKVWLWLLATNERAFNFYNRQGFKYAGDEYFIIDDQKYLNKVMTKNLL